MASTTITFQRRPFSYSLPTHEGKHVSVIWRMTADPWSIKHRQQHYFSFSAHWVNLMSKDGIDLAQSMCEITLSPSMTSSSESSSALGWPGSAMSLKTFSASQAICSYAVLQLVCLWKRSQRYCHFSRLTPQQLEIVKFMCD